MNTGENATPLSVGGTGTPTAYSESKVGTKIYYESDIDPDELLPVYLETKAKIFNLQVEKARTLLTATKCLSGQETLKTKVAEQLPPNSEIAKFQMKLKKIETDILFDQYVADQQWEKQRIRLERDAAAERRALSCGKPSQTPDLLESGNNEVAREASQMAAEVLEDGSDDDTAIADLFSSLPVSEVDSVSGKSNIVANGSNGTKVIIRDFGKTTGISPKRILEEACRARLDINCLRDLGLLTIIFLETPQLKYHITLYPLLVFQIVTLFASTGQNRRTTFHHFLRLRA